MGTKTIITIFIILMITGTLLIEMTGCKTRTNTNKNENMSLGIEGDIVEIEGLINESSVLSEEDLDLIS